MGQNMFRFQYQHDIAGANGIKKTQLSRSVKHHKYTTKTPLRNKNIRNITQGCLLGVQKSHWEFRIEVNDR